MVLGVCSGEFRAMPLSSTIMLESFTDYSCNYCIYSIVDMTSLSDTAYILHCVSNTVIFGTLITQTISYGKLVLFCHVTQLVQHSCLGKLLNPKNHEFSSNFWFSQCYNARTLSAKLWLYYFTYLLFIFCRAVKLLICLIAVIARLIFLIVHSSSSHMRVMNHNWSATKQRLHPQSVAEISRHSVLSGDRIRLCGTSSESRRKDTDQCP